jgi:hypothetical protein
LESIIMESVVVRKSRLSVVLPPARPSFSTPPLFGASAAVAALDSTVEIASPEAPSAAARPMNSRREMAPLIRRPFQ